MLSSHPVNESDTGSTGESTGSTTHSDGSAELLAALRQRRRTNIAIAAAVAVTLVWGFLWLALGDKERGLSPLSKAYYFGRIAGVPGFALLVVGIASALPGRNWFRACVAYVVIMLPGLAVFRTTFGLIEDQKEGERVGDPARSASPGERRFRLREALARYEQQKANCDRLMQTIGAKQALEPAGLTDRARILENQALVAQTSDAFFLLAQRFEHAYAQDPATDRAYVAKTKELFEARSQQLGAMGQLLAWLHHRWGEWEVTADGIEPTTDVAREQLPKLLNKLIDTAARADQLVEAADVLAAKAAGAKPGGATAPTPSEP